MRSSFTNTVVCLVVGVGALLGSARADQWDQAADSDNGAGTDNAPFHGSEQVHDLGALPGPAVDEDWYIASPHPFSSYQFVVDGLTGDLGLTSADVQLVSPTGTVLNTSVATDGQGILSLAYRRGGPVEASFIRVRGPACGTACTAADTYRARFYDTTYTIPRFNNSGTQATVLLIQNNTARACIVSVFFMDPDGDLLLSAGHASELAPRAMIILPVAGGANQSGSVRVAHECGYGGLSGKAVSIEPATGFTFDTLMVHRPY
jgi:hypothetical protein